MEGVAIEGEHEAVLSIHLRPDVTAVVKRRRKRGMYVTVLIVEGRDGAELDLGSANTGGPEDVLLWAIDAASRGEVGAIDGRVRRDGRVFSNLRLIAVQAIPPLLILGAFAWFLTPDALRRSLAEQLAEVHALSPAAQLERAPELLEDPAADEFTRCEVGRMVLGAHIELGDIPAAVAACADNETVDCGPTDGCDAHFALIRVREAAANGGPEQLAAAAGELEFLAQNQTVESFNLRMQIYSALGDDAEARRVGEECIAAYGHLSPDSDMLAPCRAAPTGGGPTPAQK